jgi:hypothetical protein
MGRPELLHPYFILGGIISIQNGFYQLLCEEYFRLLVSHNHDVVVVFIVLTASHGRVSF